MRDIVTVSAQTGMGMMELRRAIEEHRDGRDVYFVGCTNGVWVRLSTSVVSSVYIVSGDQLVPGERSTRRVSMQRYLAAFPTFSRLGFARKRILTELKAVRKGQCLTCRSFTTAAGKSSIINRMLLEYQKQGAGKTARIPTVSQLPGTTLSLIAFPLVPPGERGQFAAPVKGTFVYDTPGIVNPNQVRRTSVCCLLWRPRASVLSQW